MGRAACLKCGHPVAEHQPSYGVRRQGGGHGYENSVGCSLCNCIINMTEKLRAWGEVTESE